VSISYITLASDTPARRDQLQIDYNFLCHCSRCQELDKGEKKKRVKKPKKESQNGEFKWSESSSTSELSSYEERSGSEAETIFSNDYATNVIDSQFGKYQNVSVADVMPIDQAADPALEDIITIFEDTSIISGASTYVAKSYEKDWFWLHCLCDSPSCQGKGLWMLDLKTKKTICNLCRREKLSVAYSN